MLPANPIELSDETRRRRLVFRCWHRGMREVDLLLGRFADAHVPEMSRGDLARLETLLDIPDSELLAWLTGAGRANSEDNQRLIDAIRVFHSTNPTVQDNNRS